MSFTLDDAKAEAESTRSNNLRDNDAGIPDDARPDYSEVTIPVTKVHPETLLTFDQIVNVDVFNTGEDFLDTRQNLEHGGPQGYGNDVVVTFENPEVVDGEIWADDHDFKDLRILGDPTTDHSPYERRESIVREDGEVVGSEIDGVSLGMGGFDGEPVGEIDADYIQVFFTARRAAEVLGQLDTAGKWAFNADGEFTEGIIEAPPALGDEGYDSSADADGAPRAIGYPEVREDMVQQRGALAVTFDDEEPTTQSKVNVDFFTITDDGELAGIAPLTPDDEYYAEPTYPRSGNLYWDHDGTTPEDVGADADPETTDGVAAAQAMMGAGSDSGASGNGGSGRATADDTEDAGRADGELTYEALTDAGQSFVDAGVTQLDDKGYTSTDELDDFAERYATAAAGGEIVANESAMRRIIDARLDT